MTGFKRVLWWIILILVALCCSWAAVQGVVLWAVYGDAATGIPWCLWAVGLGALYFLLFFGPQLLNRRRKGQKPECEDL